MFITAFGVDITAGCLIPRQLTSKIYVTSVYLCVCMDVMVHYINYVSSSIIWPFWIISTRTEKQPGIQMKDFKYRAYCDSSLSVHLKTILLLATDCCGWQLR